MGSNRWQNLAGIVTIGMCFVGSAVLAAYVLFTDVTSMGNNEPASAIEAGNWILAGLALLPMVLTIASAVSLRSGNTSVPLISGAILIFSGFLGFNIGIFYIPIGVLLMICAGLFI
ncbi:MAG: hypothetical protein ABEJ42_09710 [Halobacteriaceae archaeon]